MRGTKTDAAERTIDFLPLLRDELTAWVPAGRDAEALVFATASGRAIGPSNMRRRVLAPAVERANAILDRRGSARLPDRLTPHSLRRTFASVLVARGDDPAYVMAQMGHTTAELTLGLYARAVQRRDGEQDRLTALVGGCEWAPMGTSALHDASAAGSAAA